MSVKIVNWLDEKDWREYTDKNPHSNIFHTPEMFQVYSRAKGYRPKLWGSVNEQGEIQAILLPVEVTLKDGLFHHLTTRAIAYGGVLGKCDSSGKEALADLLQAYKKSESGNVLFAELRPLSDTSFIQPLLQQCGFLYEDHLDYLINLDCSPERILQNIGSRTRKHIRRGLRKGSVVVEEITKRQDILEWYDLVQKTYKLANIPLADRSLFDAAFDILNPQRMVKFWLARIGSVCVAASVELLYKSTIYGWYGGVDRAYTSEVPSELLMWHILKWGAENGYRVYDFGGAGKPNDAYGVRDFKAKFGGKLVCFGRNIYIPHPILFSISKLGYVLYRKILFKGI